MSFLPDEPLPPGFEMEDISRPAIIESKIDSYKDGPLIGIEYVVELHDADQSRPDYFCVLCNTCNDSSSIFNHWTSFAHRNKYLQKHFKKAYDLLHVLKRGSANSGQLIVGLENLTQLIEAHFGRRLNILVAPNEDFRRFRAKICAEVREKYHPDESNGPDFTKEARKVVQDLKSEDTPKPERERETGDVIALDAISSDDESSFGPTGPSGEEAGAVNKTLTKNSRKPVYRALNRSPPNPIQKSVPTPKELSMQASHIAQERYKWEKFRCMLELQLKQLCEETETYEFNPEKHPDYPDEWKQFWNRRYKQLQEEKKCDPNRYDYKSEWIPYWKDRRIELFNIAVNKIKKDLKDRFKLGDEDEEKTTELMERYKIRVSSPLVMSSSGSSGGPGSAGIGIRRKPNFRSNRPQLSDTVIDISDDEQPPSIPIQGRRQNRSNYARSRTKSLSPKRGGPPGRPRGRRSRSRSPLPPSRREYRDRRSPSLSPRRSSRSPVYARHRGDRVDRGPGRHSRERRDDYPERDRRSDERDFYRSSRSYDQRETFRVLDSRLYPEYSQSQGKSASPGAPGGKDGAAKPEGASNKDPAGKGKATSTEPEPPLVEEGPLTVVSVLRMLAAVEEHLGSLGPKALNLLSKALAMEIVQPNAADDLLLNEDNCVFLETTKEKLKGILIAEVLDDPQKVRVVKKLITNIAAIVFQVTSRGSATGSAEATRVAEQDTQKIKKTTRDYQLPFDRNIVSTKVASALVLKGYTTVTTEDMTKLLHFLTLLVKLDKTDIEQHQGNGLTFQDVKIKLGLEPKPSSGDKSFMGIDLDELMKEVEHQLNRESVDIIPTKNDQGSSKNPVTAAAATSSGGSNGMELLTDSDLQTLLQNFKFLSTDEQVHLISHLRNLEVQEPVRVRRLRKYVNLGDIGGDNEPCSDILSRMVTHEDNSSTNNNPKAKAAPPSRGSNNMATLSTLMGGRRHRSSGDLELPPTLMAKQVRRDVAGTRSSPNFALDDEEDDDYNFDDLVMKAAGDSNGDKSNINSKKNSVPKIVPVESSPNALTFKPAAVSSSSSVPSSKILLKETESIIANLMDTLSNNSSQSLKNQQQHNNDRGTGSNYGQPRSQQQQQQQQQQVRVQQPLQRSQQSPSNPSSFGAGGGAAPRLTNTAPNNNNNNPNSAGRNYPQNVNASTGPLPQGPPYPGPYGGGGGGYDNNAYGGNPNMGQQNYPPGPYGGGGNQMNHPWGNNGPPQPPPYNMPQNYMPQQQQPQQPHFNNMFHPPRH
ncbi:uncharacterized protein Dwil_GK25038 [Drosophila willistoni]|uniref:Uncharacterized protein n=1 Tax=Drosophila willistoni TaxID=7260 RepID=B4NCR0_DROWI|nr:uncharacterized protein Dwil_GK25038 [Drosophila willistoni]